MNEQEARQKPRSFWRSQRLLLGTVALLLLICALVLGLSFTFQGQRLLLLLKARHGSQQVNIRMLEQLHGLGPEYAPFIAELMNEYDYEKGYGSFVGRFKDEEQEREYDDWIERCNLIESRLRQYDVSAIPILLDYAQGKPYDIQHRCLEACFFLILRKSNADFHFKVSGTPTIEFSQKSTRGDFEYVQLLPLPDEVPSQTRSMFYDRAAKEFKEWYGNHSEEIIRKK